MTDLDRLDVLAAELDGWPDTTILATADGNASVTVATIRSLVAAVRERDELRDVILNGGLRVPGFDHWRERASSKPSDPDDVRWDCSCGYSGSPEKVQKHWAALHHKDGA